MKQIDATPESHVELRADPPSVGGRLRKVANGIMTLTRLLIRSRTTLLLTLILVLSAVMTYYYPISFPTSSNLVAVLLNASVAGILVVGMMLLLVSGAFDLSIGGIFALSGMVAGVVIVEFDQSWAVGAMAGLGVGILAGVINGLIVTGLGVNALIATLATAGIFRGVTQLLSGTGFAPIDPTFARLGQTEILGLQSPFWVMLVVVVVGSWAVGQTRVFRRFYYVGGNERAAQLSGIRTKQVFLMGFALMGALAGLAGILNAARFNAANVNVGTGLELQVITAAVLGGASLKGGEGTVTGGILGVLFIALVQNALIIVRVGVFWQNIVIGLVLLFAVALDRRRS
ncbi:MAG: ABC transporter permease [Aeromicrobium sp.]